MSEAYDAIWNAGAAAWPIFQAVIDTAWKFLDTNFSAAMFGALGGVFGSHWIAVSKERKDRLTSGIEATNSAIGLANIIANNFLSIKKQHLLNLLETYEAQFRRLGEVEQAAALAVAQGGPRQVFTLLADFRTLTIPVSPIEPLLEIVTQKIGPAIHAGSVAQSLRQSMDAFYASMARRSNLITMLHNMDEEARASVYYGLRTTGGIDETYPDTMLALKMQCDDVIYFSMLLGEMLMKHGAQLPDLLKRHNPKVVTLVYDRIPANVLPDPAEYGDFERQFRAKEKAKAKPSLWVRLTRAFAAFRRETP